MSAPRKESLTGTWEQFIARTTGGQSFSFEVPTMDCCTNSKVRTYLAIPMAKYTIKHDKDLIGELIESSIDWIGQRVDRIRRDTERMLSSANSAYGESNLPWYNQD